MRPLSIVKDDGFKTLMKTGRPNYKIPKRMTVARDVKHVFKNTKKRVKKLLRVSNFIGNLSSLTTYQEHDGALSFGTDTWTSPNHKAYVAITVHFEHNGVPICLLLDVVQVACAHTGVNLAKAFAEVLEDYGIADKVSRYL